MPRPFQSEASIAAREALAAAQDGERRIVVATTYGQAAPYLVLWGLAWMAGFVASYFAPGASRSIWIAATCAGWLATGGLILAQARKRGEKAMLWRVRYATSALALTAYAALWAVLLTTDRPNAQGVYAGTVTGFAYLLAGFWRGPLLAGLGLAITTLFLAGMAMNPAAFQLYAGLVGGGGLIAAGLLLARRDPT